MARLRAVVMQPGAGVAGDAVARPALGGDRKRLLRGFLGEVEVAEEADQRSEDTAPLVPEDLLEDGYHSTSGRTSTAPPMLAAGILRRQLDRRVEVVGLEEAVAADGLLDLDERAVGGQGLAVLRPARSCAVSGGCICSPGVTRASR